MEQLTLEQAAIEYHNSVYGAPKDFEPIELTERQLANNIHAAFKCGAELQKERLLSGFKAIAGWAGNLPDNRLTSKTGHNDAALRGEMVVTMRQIAIDIIKKFEPDYEPRQD